MPDPASPGERRSAGLLAADRWDSVDGAIEGDDHTDAGPFRARHQVRIGEVEPMDLIHLHRPLQQVGVEDADGGERQHRPERRSHLR